MKSKLFVAIPALLCALTVPAIADDWTVSAKEAQKIMFKQDFPPSNKDLFRIVRGAVVAADAEAAWQVLASRAWNPEDYALAVCDAPPSYQQKGWERLQAVTPNAALLVAVLPCAGPPYDQQAWAALTKQAVTNKQLVTLVIKAKEPYRQLAYEWLQKQQPTFDDLRTLYLRDDASVYKTLAWKQVWDHPTMDEATLVDIIVSCRYDKTLEGNAAWDILRRQASRDTLTRILTAGDKYGDNAWDVLYALGPSPDNFREIVASDNLNMEFRLHVAKIALDRLQ